MPNRKLILPFAALLVCAAPAQAYIGPGAGAGTIAVVLGVLAALLMAFVALVYYPLKRMLRKRKGTKPAEHARAEEETSAAE